MGAAAGALHGVTAVPERWRAGLLGRTGADDDGRIFALLAWGSDAEATFSNVAGLPNG